MEILLNKQYTYADYLTWLDDTRRELINGFVKFFASPHGDHQIVSANIYRNIANTNLSNNKELMLCYAPFDVVFSDTDTAQPDILVFEKSKFMNGICKGAPIFIAEILSRTNRKKDTVEKFLQYEKYGVQEFWIVDRYAKSVTVHDFIDGAYNEGTVYLGNEKITSKSLNFEAEVVEFFRDL
jgi:Uma2 family endonuclease